MTRIATTANGTALAQSAVQMVIMAKLEFASGTIYAHDGIGQITWGSDTYDGFAKIGGIDVVQEEIDVIARPVTVTVSGVDAAIVALARDEVYQNRTATFYLGMIEDGELIADPEELWGGRMDVMEISLDQQSGSIRLNCEHRLRREPRIARYTDVDQQLAYSGDNFFAQLPYVQNYVSNWGNEKMSYGGRLPGAQPDPSRPVQKF